MLARCAQPNHMARFRVGGQDRGVTPTRRQRQGRPVGWPSSTRDLRARAGGRVLALSAAQVNHDRPPPTSSASLELRDQGFISSAELERRETAAAAALAQPRAGTRAQRAGQPGGLAPVAGRCQGRDHLPSRPSLAWRRYSWPALRLRTTARAMRRSVPEDNHADPATRHRARPFQRRWRRQHRAAGQHPRDPAAADLVTRTFLVKAADVGKAPVGRPDYDGAAFELLQTAGVTKLAADGAGRVSRPFRSSGWSTARA